MGTQEQGSKQDAVLGVKFPGAISAARCLSAAGLQSRWPQPSFGMGSSYSKGLRLPAVPCGSWGEPLEEEDSLALAHVVALSLGSGTMILAEGPQD